MMFITELTQSPSLHLLFPGESPLESLPMYVESLFFLIEALPFFVESLPFPMESSLFPVESSPFPVESSPFLVESTPFPCFPSRPLSIYTWATTMSSSTLTRSFTWSRRARATWSTACHRACATLVGVLSRIVVFVSRPIPAVASLLPVP